jgi:hypothetical protein
VEWTAKAVWWVRAVAVGVLVMMNRAKVKHNTEERKAHTG